MKHASHANKSIFKFLTAATGRKLQTATFMKLQNIKVMTGFKKSVLWSADKLNLIFEYILIYSKI